MTFSLDDLDKRLTARAKAPPSESYTARLLADGLDRCARKFGEEAVETIVAAVAHDKAGLTAEAADVLYHLLVLLSAGGVKLDDVMAELERRTAQSGLAEKAGQPQPESYFASDSNSSSKAGGSSRNRRLTARMPLKKLRLSAPPSSSPTSWCPGSTASACSAPFSRRGPM